MHRAEEFRAGKMALEFCRVLPLQYHDIKLYNMALGVCATARNFDAALAVLDLCVNKRGIKPDLYLLTSVIKGG